MKISKRKLLLSIPLAVISFEIYLGVVIGYLGALVLAGKETGKQGTVKSLILDLGKYKVHLHHWVIGLGFMPVAWHCNLAFLSDQFFLGLMGGLICQGILCYSDWHQVIFRKF